MLTNIVHYYSLRINEIIVTLIVFILLSKLKLRNINVILCNLMSLSTNLRDTLNTELLANISCQEEPFQF